MTDDIVVGEDCRVRVVIDGGRRCIAKQSERAVVDGPSHPGGLRGSGHESCLQVFIPRLSNRLWRPELEGQQADE